MEATAVKIDAGVYDQRIRREGKYLTFMLAGEKYGIGIFKVREIVGFLPVTAVPKMPVFIKGVINLRGRVIPVVDLRLKLGLPGAESLERTCIVIVEPASPCGGKLVGIVVDSVSEVLNIGSEEIEETPALVSKKGTDDILGMAISGPEIKILLDIDEVLSQA